MKTICAMQPYVFPYLPYFQLAHAVDEFWVLDDVQFIRRGWMNRNRILLAGQPHLISFPVTTGSRDDLIADKRLPENFDQSLNRLNATLLHAYGQAPQGDRIGAIMAALTSRPWSRSRFLEFALATMRQGFDALGLMTPLHLASTLNLPPYLRGQTRILALCAATGAEAYVNSIGGQTIYDPAAFADVNLRLRFLQGHCPPYPQTGAAQFVPRLSILDLIAHLPPKDCTAHLRAYALS